MPRVNPGDIFEITTPIGNAYLHFIYHDKLNGALLRVLTGLYAELPADINKIAAEKERYLIFFPVSVALHRKIVRKVGFYPLEGFQKPKYMRTKHNIGGEFLGWHIVDTDSLYRTLVKDLTDEQKALSLWGIWNDTLLIEKLVEGWSLEEWV